MIRTNHYEAAFEAYLRGSQIPYVAVDETRRSLCAGQSLKSLDFVVNGPDQALWLVDVKGRQFGLEPGQRRWENWATRDDLESLSRWQEIFGKHSRGLLVFAYDRVGAQPHHGAMFSWRDRHYDFFGVWSDDYHQHMSVRSARWDTLWLPEPVYRQVRFPLTMLVSPSEKAAPCPACCTPS